MYSKIKQTIFTSQFYVYMLLGGSILINACQEQESAQPKLEEVQYEMYDDVFVTVVLDPNKVHEFHSFASLEEHDAYLIAMEEAKEKVVVNKKMYEDLSHYFDPYQLTVMDMNYEIEVAGDLYKANREEILKKPAGTDQWEKYIFYGLSGKVDLEETALVYKNIENLDILKSYEFKSADSREIYDRKLNEVNDPNSRVTLQNFDTHVTKIAIGSDTYKEFRYRTSATGTIHKAHARVYTWQDKYKKVLKLAKGGTTIQIKRFTEFPTRGFENLTTETIGSFHVDGTPDNTQPYVYVRVKTSIGDRYLDSNSWSIERGNVDRTSDWVQSFHRAELREDNAIDIDPKYDLFTGKETSDYRYYSTRTFFLE